MTLLASSVFDATVLLALSLAAVTALRRRSAALRHAILAAAIGAAIVAPALEFLLPPLPVMYWAASPDAVPSAVTLTSHAGPDAVTTVPREMPPSRDVPWFTLLLVAWALGAGVTLAGLLVGLVRLARLTRRCSRVHTGEWRRITDELSLASGLRRPVAILQSDDPALLVTCGVLQPKIILPARANTWADDRIRIVLAHEMAHIRRRDGALQLLGELLRIVHWFNPLVWRSCRRLRQESEYACDDAVLSGGVDATEYATHLLAVAQHAAGRDQTWASASAIAHPSSLERRIAAMLAPQHARAPLTRRTSAAAAIAVTAVLVPLAAAGIATAPGSPAVTVTRSSDIALTSSEVQSPPTIAQRSRPATQSLTSPMDRRVSPAAKAGRIEISGNAAVAVQPLAVVAQQAPGVIGGTVLDQTGAVIPGVTVTITDANLDTRSTRSDANGRFTFRDLPPARYGVAASLPGFATVTAVMPLAEGETVTRSITLPLGTLAEHISVGCSGAAQALTTPFISPGHVVAIASLVRRARQSLFPTLSAQGSLPIRVGGDIRLSRKLTDARPVCPSPGPAADTTLILTGRIGVDGSISDVRSLRADSPRELIQSALDAIGQWGFTPTLLNGVPVEVNITITVAFVS